MVQLGVLPLFRRSLKSVIVHDRMQFQDYTKYLDMGCRMALLPRFQWNGRPEDRFPYAQTTRILFILGTCCLIYHNFGILVNLNQIVRMAGDTKTFVAEISEATGTLMLVSVAVFNLLALRTFRPQFEAVFTELEELYPGSGESHYRREHYFEKALRLMKFEFIFYTLFFVYFNGIPFVGLIWEYITNKKVQSYSLQLNTWHPWKIQGSPLGFGAAYLNLFLASFVGVGLSIITQDIICIFAYQLKLHFDALNSQLLALDSRQPGSHAKLRKLIAYHSRILQIGEQVNCALNLSFLGSLICATIAICMLSVAISLLDLVTAIRHLNGLVGFVVYHLTICYLGTEVAFAGNSKLPRTLNKMHLQDYMRYPDLACWMGFVPRFQWNGRPAERLSLLRARKMMFVLGTICLVYQNIGELVYWHLVGRKAEDTTSFVAEISEAAGTLMLTSMGSCNIWALSHYRPQIEEVLTELEELYPGPRERHYRRQHYCELAISLMKFELIFYVAFDVYYNGAALLVLLYEYLVDGKDMRFKLQVNTWYPWRVHGSALGYCLGFLCTFLGSIVGLAFSLATHNIICLFTYNLKLHFDALSKQLLALDSRYPDAHHKLRKLIAYHSRILHLADQVNGILNFSFLTGLVCATVAICMTSVAVLLLDLASAFKYIIGLAGFLVYHFLICYLGTEVTIAVSLQRI